MSTFQVDSVWSELGPRGRPGKDAPPAKDGRDGIDGVDGESFNMRGKWIAGQSYQKGDVVSHKGSSWVARNGVPRGRMPKEHSAFWMLLAAAGKRGESGPAGPRGRSATATSSVGEVTYSGGPFTNGSVLYITAGGMAALAQANSLSTARVAGIATGPKMLTDARYETSGLTPGASYYLSPTVPGGMTITPPTADGEYVVVLGRALSSTILDLEIAQPIGL